jgi:CheY-like chemotaxis protein
METRKRKILIVEDEMDLVRPLRTLLERRGFEVLHAADGQSGLETAERERPDGIVLDIVMPVMDGWTMLRRMRKSDWGKTVPVTVLTNVSDGPDRFGDDPMVLGYLVKSNYGISEVMDAIGKMIKDQPSGESR